MTPEVHVPREMEIPRGDSSLSLDAGESSPDEQGNDELKKNIFLEEGKKSGSRTLDDESTAQGKQISKHIRIFIFASLFTVLNLILIGLLYSYNT
jgi:hypothetical protein